MRKLPLLGFLLMLFPIGSFAADNQADNRNVVVNVKTHIYHGPDCSMAKRCTKNCIASTQNEAEKSGARPCKICNGK